MDFWAIAERAGGWLVAITIAIIAARRSRVDRRATQARTDIDLFEAFQKAQRFGIEQERRADAAEKRIEVLEERVKRVPAALIDRRLRTLNGLMKWFDRCPVPCVASSAENAGSLIYVNPAFCRGLGRSADAFVGVAWRQWLNPAHEQATKAAEASATHSTVDGFSNQFLHSDGRWRTVRWDCDSYNEGVTFCWVEIFELEAAR